MYILLLFNEVVDRCPLYPVDWWYFCQSLMGYWSVPDSSVGKESACNAGDPGSILGSGRSTGEGIGYPFQYSWASPVAQLVKSLSATCRPGFNLWAGKIPWRRERLPTPIFWPGEFHGLYSPWGHKESDTTEQLNWTELYLIKVFAHIFNVVHTCEKWFISAFTDDTYCAYAFVCPCLML